MTRHRLLVYAAVFVSSIFLVGSCAFILDTIRTGGEKELKPTPPRSSGSGPRMIIFALDGTTPAQLMEAIQSGMHRISQACSAKNGVEACSNTATPRPKR
jgi:hypothetical protein